MEVIQSLLEETSFGIICLTRENLSNNWIHFEAGALAKLHNPNKGKVWTILWDIPHSDVAPPLSQFQHTLISKSEILSLLESINKHIAHPLSATVLISVFDKWWGDLKTEFERISAKDGDKESTSLNSTANVRSEREILEELLEISRGQQQQLSSARTYHSDRQFHEEFTQLTPLFNPISRASLYFESDNSEKLATAARAFITNLKVDSGLPLQQISMSKFDDGHRVDLFLYRPIEKDSLISIITELGYTGVEVSNWYSG